MRIRVKICGITRVEDAEAAVAAGADAIGLVFYEASPRYVGIKRARDIAARTPPFISLVGLFVNAAPAEVREVLSQVGLSLLQFHGSERPEYCGGFGRPYIKAVRMSEDADLYAAARTYAGAAGLLLDSFEPGRPGGTGRAFAWERVPPDLDRPIILAGGLTPENVAGAIAAVRPYAVDVSSGVERSRGVKDPAKIAAFIRAVEEAGAQLQVEKGQGARKEMSGGNRNRGGHRDRFRSVP